MGHHDDASAVTVDDAAHRRITETRDVVDDAGPALERRLGDGGSRRVGGHGHRQLGGERFHRPPEPHALILGRDVARPVRRRRSCSDIDDAGAGLDHAERGGHERVETRRNGAGIEGFRTDVERAHHDDGRSTTDGNASQEGTKASQHAQRYHRREDRDTTTGGRRGGRLRPERGPLGTAARAGSARSPRRRATHARAARGRARGASRCSLRGSGGRGWRTP